VHASGYGMNFAMIRELGDAMQSVHNARVRAAEQYHYARQGLQNEGLVVWQRILGFACGIAKKRTTSIFKGGPAWDFAGNHCSRQDCPRCLCPHDAAAGRIQRS
jgi:hypothetical protein